jgi:hypothetical protein
MGSELSSNQSQELDSKVLTIEDLTVGLLMGKVHSDPCFGHCKSCLPVTDSNVPPGTAYD